MIHFVKYYLRWIYTIASYYIYCLYLRIRTLRRLTFRMDSDAFILDRFSNECRPIHSNAELLCFHVSPTLWHRIAKPLMHRSSPIALGTEFRIIRHRSPGVDDPHLELKRPKVLVCHDLAGNYREDRFINGSKKWDDYRFYDWAGIDYFCYFSHSYITIPPLPWINAAHTNGVAILGTVIVERWSLLSEVLQSEQYMRRIVEALVLIAKCCRFDGWFLNIECEVKSELIPLLRMFIRELKTRIHEEIPNGKVFWYDSVITTGHLRWQNELNERNLAFFNECDGILINYGWNLNNLERTAKIVDHNPALMANIFIGIDVFGRGQVAKFHTNETLNKIKQYNFSVGIFAPGWTFERVQDVGIDPWTENGTDSCNQLFIKRNNVFWDSLWGHFYTRGPTTLPFYTSFCLGSGKRKFRDGLEASTSTWFNLMEHEIQPLRPGSNTYEHFFEDAFHGGSCLKFNSNVTNLRLFTTDFNGDNDVIVSYAFKRTSHLIHMNLVLNISCAYDLPFYAICGEFLIKNENVNVQLFESLSGSKLQRVVIGLSDRQERVLPALRPVGGWEVRYYQIKLNKLKPSRVLDVGISVHSNLWRDDDYLLLGALHIQKGFA